MNIFLDDYRNPPDCATYMYKRIGKLNPIYLEEVWFVVRNHPDFVKAIDRFKGNIETISFDHDLADGHYHQNMQEGVINYDSADFQSDEYSKTGWHSAKYLKEVYAKERLPLPQIFVHSLNPVGTENIINLFK